MTRLRSCASSENATRDPDAASTRAQRAALERFPPFDHRDLEVARDVLEARRLPRRPQDLHALHFARGAEAELHARVGRRAIRRARARLREALDAAAPPAHARAEARAVRRGAHELQ